MLACRDRPHAAAKFHIYTFWIMAMCFVLAWAGFETGANWRSIGKYFHQMDAVIGVLRSPPSAGSCGRTEKSDERCRSSVEPNATSNQRKMSPTAPIANIESTTSMPQPI